MHTHNRHHRCPSHRCRRSSRHRRSCNCAIVHCAMLQYSRPVALPRAGLSLQHAPRPPQAAPAAVCARTHLCACCAGAWVRGCVGARCGCVGAWVHWCMGTCVGGWVGGSVRACVHLCLCCFLGGLGHSEFGFHAPSMGLGELCALLVQQYALLLAPGVCFTGRTTVRLASKK